MRICSSSASYRRWPGGRTRLNHVRAEIHGDRALAPDRPLEGHLPAADVPDLGLEVRVRTITGLELSADF